MKDINITSNELKSCEPESVNQTLSVSYLLQRIELIGKENAHIAEALGKLGAMKSTGPNDYAGSSIAEAIANIVASREKTNQKLLEFYMKLYDDLTK